MKTLVIFDNTGTIYFQASGEVKEPEGLNYLWVEIPENYFIESVDVSQETPIPILKEFEKSSEAKVQEQIDEINQVLLELILN